MNHRLKKARLVVGVLLFIVLMIGVTLYIAGFLWAMWNLSKMDW